ncbi:hypothetical protein O3M35_012235 [Rhynocoris fuscipes]|uniref:Uncharacterized protein n=1 Tax=Rhynocoris fuscipes TaxID=488301 RepID=A0AAW1CXF9_9HEMI
MIECDCRSWGVSTNLREADASAKSDYTSATVKDALGNQALGSAGARARNNGAASSFGLGGGSGLGSSTAAAGPDASAVISLGHSGFKDINSSAGHAGRQKRSSNREDNDGDQVLLSIGQSRVKDSVLNAGSTGVRVGPVATAVSLASTSSLLRSGTMKTAQSANVGSTAAHAGDSDSAASFSNSNAASNVDE